VCVCVFVWSVCVFVVYVCVCVSEDGVLTAKHVGVIFI
jgi:hypothetical protein